MLASKQPKVRNLAVTELRCKLTLANITQLKP